MRLTLSTLSLILAGGIIISGLAVEAKGKAGGNVTYHAAPEATLNYKDGVTVHRHADGSVEVSDPEVREPLYPSQSQPVRRAVRKRVAAHKAVAKKTTSTTTTKTQHK